MSSPKKKILIFGSCVSRDIQRISGDRFQVIDYIARQTFVSANAPALPEPDTSRIPGKFLARSVKGDFTSDAMERIRQSARKADILLIDLASERHGVIPYRGTYLARTHDLLKSELLTPREYKKHIPFNSTLHRRKFRASALALKSLLKEEKVFRKTIIIAPRFTDISIDGSRVPLSHHKTASKINAEYRYYYRLLRNLGFTVLGLPDHFCKTTPDHQWGIAQNHYITEAYLYFADQLTLFSENPTVSRRVFASLNPEESFTSPNHYVLNIRIPVRRLRKIARTILPARLISLVRKYMMKIGAFQP